MDRVHYGKPSSKIRKRISFTDQVTAMEITHAFRDAELMSAFVHSTLIGEMSMEEAMNQYLQTRSIDYDDYFDLVCKTAEMNNYSIEELKYFYSIKNNQHRVDQVISQFGDALPVFSGLKPDIFADECISDSIKQLDTAKHPVSFPLIYTHYTSKCEF